MESCSGAPQVARVIRRAELSDAPVSSESDMALVDCFACPVCRRAYRVAELLPVGEDEDDLWHADEADFEPAYCPGCGRPVMAE